MTKKRLIVCVGGLSASLLMVGGLTALLGAWIGIGMSLWAVKFLEEQ